MADKAMIPESPMATTDRIDRDGMPGLAGDAIPAQDCYSGTAAVYGNGIEAAPLRIEGLRFKRDPHPSVRARAVDALLDASPAGLRRHRLPTAGGRRSVMLLAEEAAEGADDGHGSSTTGSDRRE